MIRILFTIVVVVAVILAVIIQQPLLFLAAGLALVTTIVLMIVRLQRRRSSHRQAAASRSNVRSDSNDELESLGILEIRPRHKGANDEPGHQEASDVDANSVSDNGTAPDVERDEADLSAPSRPGQPTIPVSRRARDSSTVQSTLAIKEKAQIVRASVDDSAPEYFRDVIIPYLQAFRAAVEANTVCLLKQPDETPHYHIESIVSLNAYARSGGTFSSKQPLLERGREGRAAPVIRRASDGSLPAHSLGYYRDSIAVKEFAAAAVPHPSTGANLVLLADAMQEHTLDSDRALSLISHFARLLGAIVDNGAGADNLEEAAEYVRPRREIIGEEIGRAHRENAPLALALIYLNRAEEIADGGDREIADAERVLASRLRKSAGSARVERFGELTFGVFFKEKGAAVEKWAAELQRELEDATDVLEGGVSIGIALLHDRHVDADSFRRDATDALREAFESGTCTIVE